MDTLAKTAIPRIIRNIANRIKHGKALNQQVCLIILNNDFMKFKPDCTFEYEKQVDILAGLVGDDTSKMRHFKMDIDPSNISLFAMGHLMYGKIQLFRESTDSHYCIYSNYTVADIKNNPSKAYAYTYLFYVNNQYIDCPPDKIKHVDQATYDAYTALWTHLIPNYSEYVTGNGGLKRFNNKQVGMPIIGFDHDTKKRNAFNNKLAASHAGDIFEYEPIKACNNPSIFGIMHDRPELGPDCIKPSIIEHPSLLIYVYEYVIRMYVDNTFEYVEPYESINKARPRIPLYLVFDSHKRADPTTRRLVYNDPKIMTTIRNIIKSVPAEDIAKERADATKYIKRLDEIIATENPDTDQYACDIERRNMLQLRIIDRLEKMDSIRAEP